MKKKNKEEIKKPAGPKKPKLVKTKKKGQYCKEAVLVKIGEGQSFSGVLNAVKSLEIPEAMKMDIRRFREAKTCDFLIEIKEAEPIARANFDEDVGAKIGNPGN